MAVRVQDTIKSKNDADFPVVDASDVKGGHQQVADHAARDAITAAHRSAGMYATTQNDGKVWRLENDLVTWTEASGGGGGTLAGDVTGASGANTVAAIQGIPSMDPAGKSDTALVEVKETLHPVVLTITEPTVILADSATAGVFYVGNLDDWNGTQTPVLSKFTIAAGVVTAAQYLDLSTFDAHIWGVYDMADDATHLYVALDRDSNTPWIANGGWVVIIDKATFTVVGWATVSASPWAWKSICADGAGGFYVYDSDTSQISKYLTANHVGQAPGNLVLPVATEGGVYNTYQIRFGGGRIWATNWGSSPNPVVRMYDTSLNLVSSLPDFDGGGVYVNSMALVWDPIHNALWACGWDNGLPTHGYFKIEEPLPGVLAVTAGPVFSSGFFVDQPRAMAVTPDGKYVVAVSNFGPYVGMISTLTATWTGTFQTSTNTNDRYFGIANDALNSYMVGPTNKFTGPQFDYLSDTLTYGPLTAGVNPPTWALRYRPIGGDLTGPIDTAQVSAIKGALTPSPSTGVNDDVLALHQVVTPSPALSKVAPVAMAADPNHPGVIYVGEWDDWNGTPTPILSKHTMAGGVVTATSQIDLSTFDASIQGVHSICADPGGPVIYVACYRTSPFGGGWVAIIDTTTFAVIGWITNGINGYWSARYVCASGDGHAYVYDDDAGIIRAFNVGFHIGQAPGNGVAAVASEVSTGNWTNNIVCGGGSVWATGNSNANPPTTKAIRQLNLSSLVETASLTSITGTDASVATYATGLVWDDAHNCIWVDSADDANSFHAIQRIEETAPGVLTATVTNSNVTPILNRTSFVLRIGPNGNLYALGNNSPYVGVLDTTTNAWIDSFQVTDLNARAYVDMTSRGTTLYVCAPYQGTRVSSISSLDFTVPSLPTHTEITATPATTLNEIKYKHVAGDVVGPIEANLVAKIRGVVSPDPTYIENGEVVETNALPVPAFNLQLVTPRSLVSDGTHIYVAQSGQNKLGSSLVWKLTPSSAGVMGAGVSVDMAAGPMGLLGQNMYRDIAEDGTYLYVPSFQGQDVAVIDKATMTILGWGFCFKQSLIAVCADGAGHFFVINDRGTIYKFNTADCLGQLPGNATPVNSMTPTGGMRWITFGGGMIWAAGGGVSKIDPTTLSEVVHVNTIAGDSSMMMARYAIGSVWVASRNNTGRVYRLHASNLSWVATITGFAHPLPANRFGFIPNIISGPDGAGNPDAWIYVCSMQQSGGGPFACIIDPASNTHFGTIELSTDFNNAYEGMAVVGTTVYFGGFDSQYNNQYLVIGGSPPTISWVDPFMDANGAISVATNNEWHQRYMPVAGDSRGAVSVSSVEAIQGVHAPRYGGEPDGYVLSLASENPSFSGLTDLWHDTDQGLVWTGDLNSADIQAYDAETMALVYTGHITDGPYRSGVRRIIGDSNYVYTCNPQGSNGPNICIHDKFSGDLAGWIAMPIGSQGRDMALDGKGFIWVVDHGSTRGVRKYDIAAAVNYWNSFAAAYETETAENTTDVTNPLSVCYGGGFLWVGDDSDGMHQILDDGTQVAQLFTLGMGTHFGMTFAKGCVWSADRNNGTLYRYNVATFPALSCLSAGSGAARVSQPTYDAYTDTILCGSENPGEVTRWRADTTGVVTFIETFQFSRLVSSASYTALAVNPTGKVWVPNQTRIRVYKNMVGSSYVLFDSGMAHLEYAASGGGGGTNATQLQSYNISPSAPTNGYALIWNGSAWTPTAVPSTFVVGGDLLGSSGSQSVRGFWNVPIANVFQTPGCIFTYTGSQWYPTMPNGDLSGRYDTGVTVSRINGGTAPATPLLADVGKVIGVTAAGVYGLITAGGSVGGPQAGNNYAPVKVNVSGAAVQSWINLNGGSGFDTNNKDADVSGVLRVQQAGTAGIRTNHIGRFRVTPNDEQIPAMGVYGSTTKNTGRFLKLVDGSAPSGVGFDMDASKMAIARAGCFDLVIQPSARYISTKVIPLDVDPQDDYDSGGQTYHPQTSGRVVIKGNYAYSIATWGNNKLAFLETDITRGTVRKLASYGTGTLRPAFIDCAHDSGYSVTGDSDVFAVWWQGFGNNYWIQNLTLGTAGIATTVTIASGTVTSVRVARPVGVTFPTSPSGRIYIGLSTGLILEYDGSVNPPTYVRTLTATGGAITAMTSGCYFTGDRLWAMDASGHIDRFDIVTNTWSGSNNVAFTNVVAMRSTYYGYLALINATTVGMITAQNSAMNLFSTLPMHLFGDVQYVNYTDLAYTGGSGPMTMIVTDSLNGGFWGVSSDSSGTLSWTDGSYDSFYDLNGLATWSKAGVDLSDVDSYTSAIPVRNVLGGNRISGAYFRGNAAALTVGTTLKVVLGSAPTEMLRGDLISRPGSKDIVLCSLTAGVGVSGSVIYPLTGPAFMTTGMLPSEEIAISGLCTPGNNYCFYAIDTSAQRLVIFDNNGSTGRSPAGNTRFFPPLSAQGSLGYGPPNLAVMGQDGYGTMILVCGNRFTAVNTVYGTTRREKLMWQKTITLPSLGGTVTSICSAGSWFFVASTQGEVHQYLLSTGAFVRTIASSETGSPIVKISNNSSVHVYWVTSGTNKQFNRLNVGSATIDATATFSTGVTALDIAHDGNFGSGTRFAILTATGVYWLSNYASGTPSHFIPAPDLTTVIGGIGTLSHIMYNGLATWWITDSGKDVVWEVHFDGSAPIGWPLGGMVDFI